MLMNAAQPLESPMTPDRPQTDGAAATSVATIPLGTTPRPATPVARRRTITDWFGRIFRAGFTVEDLVLYLMTGLLLWFFWATFGSMREQEARLIESISGDVIEQWQPAPWDQPQRWEDGSLDMQFLRAQVAITAMRYKQGSISTAAISTRKNLGFVVGTIVTILGSIVIIRGVRGSVKLEADVKDRGRIVLETSLPGILMVVVGGAIVLSTILTSGERPAISDDGINCPQCGRLGAGMIQTPVSESTSVPPETLPILGTQSPPGQ
jgi:hypothetical protein